MKIGETVLTRVDCHDFGPKNLVLISTNLFDIPSEGSKKADCLFGCFSLFGYFSLFGCFSLFKIVLESGDECRQMRIQNTKTFESVCLFKRVVVAGGFEEESSIFVGEE